ncbi:MAG TPA: acetate/propionate family kinase [Candidatus Limnocylindrales bacterium]|nr:acetate/propionate family kinase [Candidatus Limnocylindrales bacterium]
MGLAGLMPAPPAPDGAPRILVLNAGSSSLKAALVVLPDVTAGRAEVSWGADASRHRDRASGLASALRELGLAAADLTPAELTAVGYRVVHGGARFSAPSLIDDEVVAGIRAVAELAPLHNGMALETIEAGRALLPDVPHVACFDTAFHATLPPEAYRYPVPERWFRDWGVRRFGFHGLSVAWAVRRSAQLLGRDAADLALVVAHLGSGCSVTAVDGGRAVETSMGLTPLEGLMMGTRSGSIDPGVPLHLMSRGLASADELAEDLDHHAGLLGVSGTSSDLRELEAASAAGDERATLAISMFVRRAAAWIASVATSLPRLDGLVFTGGIGEHAAAVRARIVERLSVLGLPPLPASGPDRGDDGRLDDATGPTAVLRVAAREDLIIAAECIAVLRPHRAPAPDLPAKA